MNTRNSVSETTATYCFPNPDAPITRAGGYIEYQMPAEMIETLLMEHDDVGNIQKFLCDYVNTQCHILGTCVRVTTC